MTIERRKRPKREPTRRRAAKRAPTIFDRIRAIGDRIPDEEVSRHPVDGAANLEHYLYGSPKQDRG
jgi:hypothetical protein